MKLKIGRPQKSLAVVARLMLSLLLLTESVWIENANAGVQVKQTSKRSSPSKKSHSSEESPARETSGSFAVTFAPTGSTPIIFRNESGAEIGRAEEDALLEVQVSAEVVKDATTPKGVDIRRLLGALPSQSTRRGSFARMKVPFEVELSNGRIIPPDTSVLIDLTSFAKFGTVQPVGAWSGGASNRSESRDSADEFNDELERGGVVGIESLFKGKKTPRRKGAPASEAWDKDSYENPTGSAFLSSPTCGCKKGVCRVTSNFGPRRSVRTKNGRRSSRNHGGMDIGGGSGTPIVAAADGCVTRKMTNRRAGYGLTVQLNHGNGYMTQYSHLQSFAPGLRERKCYKRGDLLGYMGQTGNSTGPHLHFGVYKNKIPVNPRRYLATRHNQGLSMSCTDLRASLDRPKSQSLASKDREETAGRSNSRGLL